MTARQALEAQLALERLASGDLSTQEDPKERERIAHLRARAEDMDKAARAYEEDPKGFLDSVYHDADKIRPVGSKKDQVKAQAAKMYQNAAANATAERVTKGMQFHHELKYGPQEEILVAGIWEVINDQPRVSPEVIRIMDRMWVLPPGKHKVPRAVAEHYRHTVKLREEQAAREAVLKVDDRNPMGMELGELQKKMREIDRKFGSAMTFKEPPRI